MDSPRLNDILPAIKQHFTNLRITFTDTKPELELLNMAYATCRQKQTFSLIPHLNSLIALSVSIVALIASLDVGQLDMSDILPAAFITWCLSHSLLPVLVPALPIQETLKVLFGLLVPSLFLATAAYVAYAFHRINQETRNRALAASVASKYLEYSQYAWHVNSPLREKPRI